MDKVNTYKVDKNDPLDVAVAAVVEGIQLPFSQGSEATTKFDFFSRFFSPSSIRLFIIILFEFLLQLSDSQLENIGFMEMASLLTSRLWAR